MPYIIRDFSTPHQQEKNWCWAAVCAAVQKIFKQAPDTQVALAHRFVGGADQSASLPNILGQLNYHTSVYYPAFRPFFATFQAHLNQGRPICAEVAVGGGMLHDILIFGWDEAGDNQFRWWVYDPLPKDHLPTAFPTTAKDYVIGDYPWHRAYLISPSAAPARPTIREA